MQVMDSTAKADTCDGNEEEHKNDWQTVLIVEEAIEELSFLKISIR